LQIFLASGRLDWLLHVVIISNLSKASLNRQRREVAILAIALGLRGRGARVGVNLLEVSPADVVDLDYAGVEGKGLWVVLVDFWKVALHFQAAVKIPCEFVGEVKRGELLRVFVEEDVMSVLVQLVGALRIVRALVELGLAATSKGSLDATVQLSALGGSEQKHQKQRGFH
jgi:hypothetical protein